MDDQTEVALKEWDKLFYENKPVGLLCHGGCSRDYSGVYHAIQSICKSVQTHGCERFGRISEFYSFLMEKYGFSSISSITFEGNRFNGLFYNGGVLFSFYEQLKEFFEVFKDNNKLLKWTCYDLHVMLFICGCRALGLINKFVIGPLWCLFESENYIPDFIKCYQQMVKFFDKLSMNSSEFIGGNTIF